MIYLVLRTYDPNTAATNRFMGLLKSFSAHKIDVTVCFLMSDDKESVAPALPHVQYKYYWERCNPSFSKLKLLLYLIYIRFFLSTLKEGDVVYTYGCNEMLRYLVQKRGVRVYHERTEHPEVSKLKILNMKRYIEACKLLDGLFVISNPLKEYFISKGVDESKIFIINMTVNISRFTHLCKQSVGRYIAYCGNGSNNKDGVDQLIKAFAITSQFHPDVKLFIIGSTPKIKDKSGNLELVDKLGLSDKVWFTGVISASEIPQMLTNAQVLVLARPHSMQAHYGFPTKLGEYLLTGNPVVVTSVGDIPLFLTNGKNALLTESSDPNEVSDKLNWALDNPNEANIIGQSGKECACLNFNSESEALKIIKIVTQND